MADDHVSMTEQPQIEPTEAVDRLSALPFHLQNEMTSHLDDKDKVRFEMLSKEQLKAARTEGISMGLQFGHPSKYVSDPKECESLKKEYRKKNVHTIYVFSDIIEQCHNQFLQLQSLKRIFVQYNSQWQLPLTEFSWLSILKTHTSKANSKVKISSIKDAGGNEFISFLIQHNQIDWFNFYVPVTDNFYAKNSDGATPLHIAALNNRHEFVMKLIENGADVNAVNNQRETPLFIAAQKAHDEIVEMLLANPKVDVNIQPSSGSTALLEVLNRQHSELAMKLIRKGANVDVRDEKSNTPLILAARMNDLELVEEILSKKADVNIKSIEFDKTALMVALDNRNPEMVRAIQAYNPDQTITDKTGKTALFKAAQMGREDIVRILLPSKALNIAETEFGLTPLMAATENGFPRIMKLLLQQPGISTEAKSKEGLTAMSIALTLNRIYFVHLLRSQSLNAVDGAGFTPLMFAIVQNRKDVVESLMKEKPKLDTLDPNGHTAMNFAIFHNRIHLVELLLPGSLEVVNALGYTPLMYALDLRRIDILRLLLSRNANVNYCSPSKDTALQIALTYDYAEISSEILRRKTVVPDKLFEKKFQFFKKKKLAKGLLLLTAEEKEFMNSDPKQAALLKKVVVQLIQC